MSSASKSEEVLRTENDIEIKCLTSGLYTLCKDFTGSNLTIKIKEFINKNIKKLLDCYIGKERCSCQLDIEYAITDISFIDTLCSYENFEESFPEYLPVISLIYFRYIENYCFDDGFFDTNEFMNKYKKKVRLHIDKYVSTMYKDQYYTIISSIPNMIQFTPSLITDAIILSRYGYGYNENEKISRTVNLIKGIMLIQYIPYGTLVNIFRCIGRFCYSDLICSLLLMLGGLKDCCTCDYDEDVYTSIALATLYILDSMSKSDINYILLYYNTISSYTYGYRFNFDDSRLMVGFDSVIDVVIDLRNKGFSI